MAKDPAFLFYTGDFSTGTQFFTDEQVGKYIRLLMAQHQLGHLEEKHMIMICKSYDNDVFSKFIKDSNGLYFNEKLEYVINERKEYSLSRSKNRKGKVKQKNISKTYDIHMEDEDIFNIFRIKYVGTKKGNKTEFKNFIKKHKDWKEVLPQLKSIIENQISIREKRKRENLFVPEWKNLQTWINGRCWEEEFEETPKEIYKKSIEEKTKFVDDYIKGSYAK